MDTRDAMTSPLHPYRTPPSHEDGDLREQPPVDLVAARTIGWLGGGFHAVGLVALVSSVWLAAFASTALFVRVAGGSDTTVGYTPWLSFALSLVVTVLAHGARRVGDDVWRGQNLNRCRIACAVVCLLGPLGLAFGLIGLFALSRARMVRLFES